MISILFCFYRKKKKKEKEKNMDLYKDEHDPPANDNPRPPFFHDGTIIEAESDVPEFTEPEVRSPSRASRHVSVNG